MPREPEVVTLGIFYISNLLYRRCANGCPFSVAQQTEDSNRSGVNVAPVQSTPVGRAINSSFLRNAVAPESRPDRRNEPRRGEKRASAERSD